MTVTYSRDVSTTNFAGFAKLLFKWRGGIYRLIYRELLLFTATYYILAAVYRFALSPDQMRIFERIVLYCRKFSVYIPITFVLGFYVSLVITRWWDQYMTLPWVDRICYKISALIKGTDNEARLIRRTLARYLNLMEVFVLRSVSTVVHQRFPSIENVKEAGLMTDAEALELENSKIMQCKVGEAGATEYSNWAVPAIWFVNIITKARKDGRIETDRHYQIILDEMLAFRSACGHLWSFDWISVPLVYTQVVTIAISAFVFFSLFGSQYLYGTDEAAGQAATSIDEYFPLLTFFQFFFYVGWLKVAEELINPLGGDDNDFELNYLVDRNLDMSFFIVDDMHMRIPPLEPDVFWKDPTKELPYTASTLYTRLSPWMGSAISDEKKTPFVTEDEIQDEPIYDPVKMIRRLTSRRHPRMRKITRARSQSSVHSRGTYSSATSHMTHFPAYLARKLSSGITNRVSPRIRDQHSRNNSELSSTFYEEPQEIERKTARNNSYSRSLTPISLSLNEQTAQGPSRKVSWSDVTVIPEDESPDEKPVDEAQPNTAVEADDVIKLETIEECTEGSMDVPDTPTVTVVLKHEDIGEWLKHVDLGNGSFLNVISENDEKHGVC